ncbi:bifunctional diaminohydroxyphosphoribosylaminopyrimidine deaminase/5-amino-6-(5-phosphoribosylamino)uracil reductase RibD [Porticoccus sp. W117]|uniref:bifunctional diaminohydroxyphosphoribosylaminopyrimidine deaminase/5-amino-6-(5-phosphoribosylamino)uracil reductase RibD n=1 Tax=Porticoccus sp. W117 TaxID=3054777 RepID=UPI002598DD6F|nr:bifunctional diaminohydroxyphosphoribosylaminopyrimidine deaminase/5-amino-6-(5-phosphoribosylamino)uracil reductase RibD [Porticoccus sp. W117]MDM3872066.1 bifunctional diaminohydroxyphosphoribosylaminopyrimidine deaminase/5-amino-6-(5-phosphoribosylamino)uracil reductase RibD [Porticoccus sp. W117]
MSMNTTDQIHMARAVQLARCGRYTTSPNPRVGCVIERDGVVIGEGWHQWAGEGHAEVNALAAAGDASGATVYVTLEPCSHQGLTGPCAEALVNANVAKVIYGMEDPNPKVAGRGLQFLRDAGIAVEGPLLEAQCQQLNPGFCKRMTSDLPRVAVKLAMSIDGRTAMASGESQWITGPAARADVQKLRASSCAIVTGIGTVLQDDPAMTVRDNDLGALRAGQQHIRQPLKVVVDSAGKLPVDATIRNQPGELLVVTAGASVSDAESIALPADSGQVDLLALLQELARRQCNEVLVEAGAELAGAFVEAGLVDQLVIYQAPTLLGSSALPLLNLPFEKMAEQLQLTITDTRTVGDDIRITAVPKM